ncbi:hypothetical protein Q3G72_002667 [Acer saccharum]|nr:hypothetical protein Q3G72_002667 [Acer saccharum]
MEIFKHLMLSFLSIATLIVMVHADSHSGFISIDCGLPENSGYTDKKTGINYTSDATFTETGLSYNISSEYNSNTLEQQFLNVRSFPDGTRNCYTIKPALENIKFLIRARFMYGNYDGRSKLPSFVLLLGADVWDSVELGNASTIVTKEIIHIPRSSYLYVCLVNTGSGTPFISSLEFRVLKNTTYRTQSGSLLLYLRLDLGSTTNETIRYGDDIYDRIWEPYNRPDWVTISTSSLVYPVMEYQQPSAVMSTAVTPSNGNDSLTFSWVTGDNTTQYYIYLHFAELQHDQMTKQTRQMYIYVSRTLCYDEYNPPRIILLNLSSSGLVGEIPPFISSLTMIESLDLSNNSFTGPVPSFLPQLPYLKVLNLAGNKLKGSVPAELIERRDNDFLTLSVDGNPDLCLSTSCTKEKNVVVPVLASIVAVSVLVAASSILWILKTRKEGYCDDGTHMGMIYEFMANGNLESHLLDEESSTADVLSWEGRLRIATETAEGKSGKLTTYVHDLYEI